MVIWSSENLTLGPVVKLYDDGSLKVGRDRFDPRQVDQVVRFAMGEIECGPVFHGLFGSVIRPAKCHGVPLRHVTLGADAWWEVSGDSST